MKIEEYSQTSCACSDCKNMCLNRPCWGTPEDIEKIISAGFSNLLMLDWYASDLSQEFEYAEVYLITPAILSYEKYIAPHYPQGRCSFLTKDLKCMLHDLKLKPIEGKIASCNTSLPQTKGDNFFDIHKQVAMQWKSEKGLKIVEEFKKQNLI